MEKTYKLLSVSAVIFKILAWLSLVIGIVSSVIIFIGGGTPDAPRTTGFIGILLGVVYFFVSFTVSEVITLLLDMSSRINKGQSV